VKKLYGIEFFRGVAAIMVVIYHVSRHYHKNFAEYPLSEITKFGHAGVDFFFTLSGFIILYVHYHDIGKKELCNTYIFKRFSRVYPFFWFVTCLHLVLIPFISSASYPDIWNLCKNIVLWPQGGYGLINGVSWTLQHEILFYLLFGCVIFNRYLGYSILLIWFSTIVLFNYFLTIQLNLGVLFSAFNLQFFMGMIAALVLLKSKVAFPRMIFVFGVCLFVIVAYLELQGGINGYGNNARLFYGVASVLIIIGSVAYENNNTMSFPWIAKFLGKSSYSIYLTHLFFNGILFKLFLMWGLIDLLPHWVSALSIIFLIIILACLVSVFIEIPLTRLIRKRVDIRR